MKKNLLISFIAMFFAFTMAAQVNEVSLVAYGFGESETEAVNRALKNAIEQAYGVFVSSNTDILNDEVVKDEIATVSSGNIHSYKELSCIDLPTGFKRVSVSAVVSVSNLVEFAKSKGADCEFAGAVFGANLKLIQLNRANAQKATKNMMTSLNVIAKTMYDYELVVGQPTANGRINISVVAKANENYKTFTDIVYNTLTALSVKNEAQLEELREKYTTAGVVKFMPKSFDKEFVGISDRRPSYAKGTPEKVGERISVLFNLYSVMDEINRIQKNALYSFYVEDNQNVAYIFEPTNLAAECETEILDRTVQRNFDAFNVYLMPERSQYSVQNIKLWAIRRQDSEHSHGGFMICIPEAAPGSTCMEFKETFQVPLNHLMSVTNFSVKPGIPDKNQFRGVLHGAR